MPIVLSGLVQTAESQQQKRSPLISKIPLLGNLFKNKNKTRENMQMVIYLVPHLEGEPYDMVQENTDHSWVYESFEKLIARYSEKEGAL